MVHHLSRRGHPKKRKRANPMGKYIFAVDFDRQIRIASGIGFDWWLGKLLPFRVKNVAVIVYAKRDTLKSNVVFFRFHCFLFAFLHSI